MIQHPLLTTPQMGGGGSVEVGGVRRYDNIPSDPCTIHFPSHQQRFATVTVTAALRQDKGISSAMVEMTHDDDTRSQARVTV